MARAGQDQHAQVSAAASLQPFVPRRHRDAELPTGKKQTHYITCSVGRKPTDLPKPTETDRPSWQAALLGLVGGGVLSCELFWCLLVGGEA